MPLQHAGKRSDTGFVGNRNESAGNLHKNRNPKFKNRYIGFRVTNLDSRFTNCVIASAIKNDILGRWIKHRATTDRFAKCFAKVTQARITNFGRGLGDVVASGA